MCFRNALDWPLSTSKLCTERSQGKGAHSIDYEQNPPPPCLSPVQAQTCSLGCRKVTGCRQSTWWSSRQCISHRSCWRSWRAMLKGCARRRKREGRDGIRACWGELRLTRIQRGGHGAGRGQVGRGGVRGRVWVRGWSRDSDRLLRLIESWSPCSTRILLHGLICYKRGEKIFSQWVHNTAAGFVCLCFLLHLTLLSSCPFPLKPLTAQPHPGLHNSACTCRTAQNLSLTLAVESQTKDCLGCKDSHSVPETLLPRATMPLRVGLRNIDRTHPCSGPLQSSSVWKWMQAFTVALQLNFTASSLPIYAHFSLPGACTFSPLLWGCQCSTPFLTHLYYSPCLLTPFPIFMESQWELDGPAAHRQVRFLFARPMLFLQDSHWEVSDPSTPLGRASWGVSLGVVGRYPLCRGDSVW